MKLVYLFLFVSLVYSADTILYYLQPGNNPGSNYLHLTMLNAFNSTGLFTLINNVASPETLFAVSDPGPTEPPISFTANLLKYHCVDGVKKNASLPNDGFFTTQLGSTEPLRIVKFESDYWLNGAIIIYLSDKFGYFDDSTDSAQVTNGVIYTIPKPLTLLTTENKLKIIDVGSMDDLGTGFSFIQQLVSSIRISFTPSIYAPDAYWTFFVPSDMALSYLAAYQKDFLLNSQADALAFVLLFGVRGSHFLAPLRKDLSVAKSVQLDSIRTPVTTWDFGYLNQGPLSDFLTDAVIERSDILRADGVMHTIGKELYPKADFPFPLPRGNEFVQQFATFDYNLRVKLISGYTSGQSYIDYMVADLVAQGITIPQESTIFIVVNSGYTTGITDPNLLKYHIIPVKMMISQLTSDTLISTLSISNGATYDQIRYTQYGSKHFLNGYSEIVQQDIPLLDGYIHLIDKPLTLPLPALPYDQTCDGTCHKVSTINQTISADGQLSYFRQLLENAGFEVNTPPLTVLVFNNPVFDNFNVKLFPYLLYNQTTRDEFLRRHIIPGTYYPSATNIPVSQITNLEGLPISIYPGPEGKLIFDAGSPNVPSTGLAHLRADGVLYNLDQPLYSDFIVPDTPLAPTPIYIPTPPQALPFDPNKSASFVNSVTLVFLIISCLLVFIQ